MIIIMHKNTLIDTYECKNYAKNRTRKLMLQNECNRKNEQSSDWSTVDAAYTIQPPGTIPE